jgi:hypothetical protein
VDWIDESVEVEDVLDILSEERYMLEPSKLGHVIDLCPETSRQLFVYPQLNSEITIAIFFIGHHKIITPQVLGDLLAVITTQINLENSLDEADKKVRFWAKDEDRPLVFGIEEKFF